MTPLFILLDARDKCTDGKCIRYDPKKFAKSPSIMTYFPGGRLGNMLTTYLTLYWLKLEFGYDTYYEKEAYYVSTYFYHFFVETYKSKVSYTILRPLIQGKAPIKG